MKLRGNFHIPIQIASSVLCVGILFRVMHWPFASLILLVALVTLIILLPIQFWRKPEKKILDYFSLMVKLSWAVFYLIIVFHLPYQGFFRVCTMVLMIGWLITWVSPKFMISSNENSEIRKEHDDILNS